MRHAEQDVIDRIDELVEWELTESPAAKYEARHKNWPMSAPSPWQAFKDLWYLVRWLLLGLVKG
jgi:hypothetical protein